MSNTLISIGLIEGYLCSIANVPDKVAAAVDNLKAHLEGEASQRRITVDSQAIKERVVEISEEEKITNFIAEKGVTIATPKKERKKHNMSPEARAAAGERMRVMQARKKAKREAAEGGTVGEETPMAKSTQRPPGPPLEEPIRLPPEPEAIVMGNGVRANPDGSYSF